MKINCSNCDKEINRRPSLIKKYKNQFCSKECHHKFYDTRIEVYCFTCGKSILRRENEIKKSKDGNFFCSKSCKTSFTNTKRSLENHPNWKNGESSYRKIALDNKTESCEKCGYDEYIEVLEVHHKDKNRKNNDISNLEILCPTCHKIEHFKDKGIID